MKFVICVRYAGYGKWSEEKSLIPLGRVTEVRYHYDDMADEFYDLDGERFKCVAFDGHDECPKIDNCIYEI